MSANTPPEAPERGRTYHSADGSTVYVWSFGNCSGRAKLIARRAVDPDWGPR